MHWIKLHPAQAALYEEFKVSVLDYTRINSFICYELTISGRVFTVIFQRPGGHLDCSIEWMAVSGMGWKLHWPNFAIHPMMLQGCFLVVDKGIEGGRVDGIDNEE